MLPLNKATYRVRAIACSFGVSEDKGTTQIAVECQVAEGEFTGETIAWVGHFTEKTVARTFESLFNFGWAGDDLSELGELDEARATEMLPSEVDIVCEPEEYQSEWKLRVRWVNKPGAGKFEFKAPLTGSALKAFAAQMKGTIRGARGAAGSRPATQQRTTPQSRGSGSTGTRHPNAPDDDIPF